jgi:protein-tyrosine phosphatase
MKSVIYWIESPWPGRLAIVPRPRGGDWLEDEINSWRKTGIDGIVSALTTEEIHDFELFEEEKLAAANGLEYLPFPIPDRGLPGSMEQMKAFARKLEPALSQGRNIAIHCRQGIGRSSMLAACTLILGGVEPGEAFARIETGRGCPVPDTPEQRDWVLNFAKNFGPVAKA